MRQPLTHSGMRCKNHLKVKQKEHHARPSGTSTQVRIKESTYQELKRAQEKLEKHLGASPSLPLIIRRSLSSYLRAITRMDEKGLEDEAFILKEHFR